MKTFFALLIAVVGCCLCYATDKEDDDFDQQDQVSCRQLQDVASTMDLISKDAFADEVVNQIQRKVLQSGLPEANTRTFVKPLLAIISKLDELINKMTSFQIPKGGDTFIIAQNAIFKQSRPKIKHRKAQFP